MIKKVFLVLISLSLFLFFSCGSTKPEAANVNEPEPPVQTEEVQEQSDQEQEEQAQIEDAEETETNTEVQEDSQKSEDAEEDEDINSLYPPLDEIEEPDLIELEPVEQTTVVDEQEEEKNQITEPVEEVEELPPLPEAVEEAEGAETEEGLEGAEGTETDEGIEPTIEIESEEEEPEPEIVIVPSRSVTLKKGETLVITYPGNGWIYMGSTSEYNNLASRGRKLGTTDTKYTLFAKESGTQIHHFYKVDNLTGEYIDDYIEVTVLDKKGKSSTVVNAPDYAEVVPKKPETPAKAKPKPEPVKQTEENQAEAEKPAAVEKPESDKKPAATEKPVPQNKQTPKPVSEPEQTQEAEEEDSVIEIDTEEAVIVIDEEDNSSELEPLIENARTLVSSKKYDDAYPALIQYLELSTDNRDEALFLLGQILESNSKYRDIKQSVETYQTLCDNYPASKYWDKANKRIVYLKRFYINIH